MKRAVSISIGSSKRDKSVDVELLGEEVRIERIGTDGDMEKAAPNRYYLKCSPRTADSQAIRRRPVHPLAVFFNAVEESYEPACQRVNSKHGACPMNKDSALSDVLWLHVSPCLSSPIGTVQSADNESFRHFL